MSKQSSLREAIYIQLKRTDFMVPQGLGGDELLEEVRRLRGNAILDAVIAALPMQVDMSQGVAITEWTYSGSDIIAERNKAINDIKAILEAAKSGATQEKQG